MGVEFDEAFKIGQKLFVWGKLGSRPEKLKSRSRGFNSRAFYAHVRLVIIATFSAAQHNKKKKMKETSSPYES